MTEIFLTYAGINVYHCYKYENALMFWFSIAKTDTFGFDIRGLPGWRAEADKAEIIKSAIDRKTIRKGMKVDDVGRVA